MSELQNEETVLDVTEPEVIENQEIEADLAPDSDSQHEKKAVDETANQEAVQKAINKKHFEFKQKERDLEVANKRIADFEATQREQEAAKFRSIAPLPDSFDDDYETKMQARDTQIAQKAQFDAQQTAINNQQQFDIQQQQQQKQIDMQAKVQTYATRTKELGIGKDEMQAAGNTVAQYGLSDDLVMHILGDSDGPLITKHLAENPQEGFKLASMSPYAVGSFLDGIKAKAAALKPKTTNAPAPAQKLNAGVHAKDTQYKNIGGAKFE